VIREILTGYYSALMIFVLILLGMPVESLAEADTRLADSLRKNLEEQGWQEYQARDGTIIYRQPATQSAPASQMKLTIEQQRQKLGKVMKERGWQVDWRPDGSLILKPQVSVGTSVTGSKPAAVQSQTDLIPDLPGFEYWRIERGADGSMLFHPLVTSVDTEAFITDQVILGRCEGYQLQTKRVSLPVDQWSEVNELVQGWLEMSGLQGLLVGKVRKILRIYLVSLVEDNAPYALKHQLAVRVSDGRVMLLE